MTLKAALALIVMAAFILPACAEENAWPSLAVGEIKKIDDATKISAQVLGAAGFASPPKHHIEFTFFKALHGQDYLIIDPCCGEHGNDASLFQRSDAALKSVDLVMGDPRQGFTLQEQASHLTVKAGAKALLARVDWPTCEDGSWTYYYQFNEADRPVLLSVIDTSCLHLGVREFYHAKNVDLGHWWLK